MDEQKIRRDRNMGGNLRRLRLRASVLVELNKIYGCGYDSFFEGLDEAPNLF